MFEYCSSRHTDLSYEFAGTIDCAILNQETGILLAYSIVNMGGQWMQLHVVAPMRFEDFVSQNLAKGKNLKELFQAAKKQKGLKLKVKCVTGQNEQLIQLVRKDAAELTPADLASLETIIAEVF